jgi:pimeloyl-ACP methyl ester carboxylesterase
VRSVYVDQAKVTPELVDRYYDLTLRAGNRHALVERFRQVLGGEGVEKIPQIAVPTLILWGKDDHLIPLENGEHFHKDIKGSQLVMLDGLGHVPHEEDPVKTVAAVKGFLGK